MISNYGIEYPSIKAALSSTRKDFKYLCHLIIEKWQKMQIWVRSWNCSCLFTWFCYHLIAKPGNRTATVSWPDPYILTFPKINSQGLLDIAAPCPLLTVCDMFRETLYGGSVVLKTKQRWVAAWKLNFVAILHSDLFKLAAHLRLETEALWHLKILLRTE